MDTGPGVALPQCEAAGCVYLDYNATTPVFPEVAAAMIPFVTTHFGNPSSGHVYGRTCAEAVAQAREHVAKLVNASPDEIVFTSCGTESDNWAIWGTVSKARDAGIELPHVVSTAIEHPAVLEALAEWKRVGALDYTLVGCDAGGCVSAAEIQGAIRPSTCLVTVMHSNNEVGSLQPIAEIAKIARSAGALLHVDAAQSMGKVAVDARGLGADLLTVVGHKFGAPKGVAALYVRKGVNLGRFLHGGGQEAGRRAGTENVILLVGLGRAAEIARVEAEMTTGHMREMRDRLRAKLLAAFPEDVVRVNGPSDDRLSLPNTLSLGLKGLVASSLLGELRDELAASAGAACHSADGPAVSSVLKAMAVPVEFAIGTLRLSTGRHTTVEEVDRAVDLILRAARRQGVATNV